MDIRVNEQLWATSTAPGGLLERWRLGDCAAVICGQVVAEVRIEESRHEIFAPAAGRLRHRAREGDPIDPGAVIGTVESAQ